MSRVSNRLLRSFSAVLLLSLILAACAPSTPPASTSAPAVTSAPAQPAATEPSAASGPKVGGTVILSSTNEPDTLDIQKSSYGITCAVTDYFQGYLLAKDLGGKYVPYLAESWTPSEDGKTWEFKLKQGVKFTNGEEMTAADWVFTIERAKDPATNSPISKGLVDPVVSAEAVDDYTLRITLNEPFYPILENFAGNCYLGLLNKKAVEDAGENYGTNPVGVGPFKLKEWVQDERIVLERNPDYTWGPVRFPGENQGPYYIETVEFRILPEYATQLAGLESGELTIGGPQAKDVELIRNTGKYDFYEGVSISTFHVTINTEKPPFDDVRVRKAFSMATDRQAIIKIVTLGTGVELHGPMSTSLIGYDPNVEQVGYSYNLEEAKKLLQEAGYTYDSNGMASKDGQPLELVLKTPTIDSYVKTAQILLDQYKALGANVSLEQYEWGTLSPQYVNGDFQFGTLEIGWPEADILYLWFHSSQLGALNWNRVQNPELDDLLEKTRTETDATKRQEYVNEAQAYVAREAYIIPIFAFKEFTAISKQVEGEQFSSFTGLLLSSAYLK